MCTDLAPELQEEEHGRLLPALIAVMDDFENPRVQAHSAAAIVNFTEGGSQVTLPNNTPSASCRGLTVRQLSQRQHFSALAVSPSAQQQPPKLLGKESTC